MKSFVKCLITVCVLLGSFVGAGFATGKEVFLFFHGGNVYYIAAVCFICFSLCFYLIFYVGKKFNADSIDGLFSSLFGKYEKIPRFSLLFCYFLLLSTMLAGANMCLAPLINLDARIPLFSAVTAALCGLALMYNLKGLKIINALFVPVMMFFIIFICCKGIPDAALGEESAISPSLSYVSFNSLLLCGVMLPLGRELTKKEMLICSLCSAGLIVLLLVLIILRLNDGVFAYIPMPLIYLAKERGKPLFYIATAVLYLSVVTSVISNALPLINSVNIKIKNKFLSVTAVMFAATLFSLLGFSSIIDASYPLIALFGIIFIASLLHSVFARKELKLG